MRDISSASPFQRSSRPAAPVAARVAAGALTGVAALGVACAGLGIHLEGLRGDDVSFGAPLDVVGQPIALLHAAPNPGEDQDADGLPDDQEVVLGLLPGTADSDGDGFGDGEEIARQSDPLDYDSVPVVGGISASLTARGEGSNLRLVICLHEPAGEIGDAKVRIGALTHQGAVSVPIARFLGLADIYETPGADSSRVTIVDLPLNANFVHANHHVTFFLAAGNFLDPLYNAASKIDVQSVDDVLLLLRPVDSSVQSLQGGGSIRQPIPPVTFPMIPATWMPGAVCFQRAVTVGGNGVVVLKEVVEADCLPGWDTFCASDCSAALGTTFQTIDPAALIGG